MADKRNRERGNSLPRDEEVETKIPKLGQGGFPDYDKKLSKDNAKAYELLQSIKQHLELAEADIKSIVNKKRMVDDPDAAIFIAKLRKVKKNKFGNDPILLFDAMDTNKNGVIEKEEVLNFLQKINLTIDEDEMKSFDILFNFIDDNNDNVISKDEFVSAITTIDEAKQALYKRLSDKNIEIYSVPSVENLKILEDLMESFSEKKQYLNLNKFKLRNDIANLDLTNPTTSFTSNHIAMLNKFVELPVDDLLLEIQFADWCKAFLVKVWKLKSNIADVDSFLLDFFSYKYNEMIANNTQLKF